MSLEDCEALPRADAGGGSGKCEAWLCPLPYGSQWMQMGMECVWIIESGQGVCAWSGGQTIRVRPPPICILLANLPRLVGSFA